MYKYLILCLFYSLLTTSCDLSPDILCERDSTCLQENPGLGCFKGHCLPKTWIKKAKKLYEEQNACRYCPKDGERCVDVVQNNKHCGSCNSKCENIEVCQDAKCQCPPHLVLCSKECVDTESNPEHCGDCRKTCGVQKYCYLGRCVDKACEKQNPSLTSCGYECVSLNTHPLHCGHCENPCRGDQHCIGGSCRCVSTQKTCDGRCVDTQNNRNHCGGCGKACLSGKVCGAGKCLSSCPRSTPNICFGGCFDLNISSRHCGKCGNRCKFKEQCIKGLCTNTPKEDPSQEPGDGGESTTDRESTPDELPENVTEKNCSPTNNGKERCDGQDNDCNGKIDDLPPQECYSGPQGTSGVGPCKKGQQQCLGGSWGKCEGESLPKVEDCNGQDDDCDGKIDNISERSCYSGKSSEVGKGSCRKGLQSCQSGKWGPCKGESLPQTEVCNNIDDNCDGQVDEKLTKKCFTGPNSSLPGLGICKSGISTCQGGKWGSCTGEVTPQKEICDGKDNDCNGIDDSFTRPCYGGPPGTAGKGLCKNGSQTCALGKWGPCTQQTLPTQEVCNNKDDNCNGQIDEQLSKSCFTGPGVAGKGSCKQGNSTCKTGKWGPCLGQVTATTEKCDRIDNDCDGEVDEKCTCVSGTKRSCGNHTTKPCRQGTQSCNAKGQWETCLGQILPSNEVCDNKDNDCDGLVDEVLTKACYTGPNGTLGKGRCKAGIAICSKGSWGVCQGQAIPFSIELCNGVDDDCDGQIDESPPNPPNCSKNVGVCQGIKKKCVKGTWQDCSLSDYQQYSSIYQINESICDNKDNDCDGKSDEDCPWVLKLGGSSKSIIAVEDIHIDKQNNVYITGNFSEQLNIGTKQYLSAGGKDAFIAKLTQGGKVIWIVPIGSSQDDGGNSIVADTKGYVYITGYFSGKLRFGSKDFVSRGKKDIFISKLDSSGKFIWTVQAGSSSGEDRGAKIILDNKKNVIVVGYFSGLADFGSSKLKATNFDDIFISKLDPSGKFIWTAQAGSPTDVDGALGVAVDQQGNIYTTGYFGSTAKFGNVSLKSKGSHDIFIAKTNPKGTFVWAKRAGSILGADDGVRIAVGSNGNLYVVSFFYQSADFGTQILKSKGNSDIAITKMGPSGRFIWTVRVGSTGPDQGRAVMTDAKGNIYVAGYFSGTADFGSKTLVSKGHFDTFVTKLDGTGKFIWAVSAGSTTIDGGLGISADSQGWVYSTGIFSGSINFGSNNLTTSGLINGFVWKMPKK